MKALSELVADAYGDTWETAGKYADKYGWILWDRSKAEGVCHYFDLNFETEEIQFKHIGRPTGGVFWWRPAILSNVDGRNGGWNIIERLADLPKKKGKYKVIYKTGQRPEVPEKFDPDDLGDRRYWMVEVALWKKKDEEPYYFPERLRRNI